MSFYVINLLQLTKVENRVADLCHAHPTTYNKLSQFNPLEDSEEGTGRGPSPPPAVA